MLPPQFKSPKRIGVGGFGTVWEAIAPGGLTVAVKVPDMAAGAEQTVNRFGREVRIQSALEHSNVAEILDFDLSADPPWCALPLAAGNLSEYVRNPAVSADAIIAALRGSFDGVEHAHESHVLHRDLKPENVLIFCEEGAVVARISDFGLSRRFTRELMTEQTESGWAAGTRWFAAPEQWTNFANVTVSSDIYSLGRITESCLDLRPDMEDAYPGLRRVVSVATRPDPNERYRSVSVFSRAFALATLGASAHMRPTDQLRELVVAAAASSRADSWNDIAYVLLEYVLQPDLLRSMIQLLPYEVIDHIAHDAPELFRPVLTGYAGFGSEIQVEAGLSAVNFLNHCLTEFDDPLLRVQSLIGLIRVASALDMHEFTTVCMGWIYDERSSRVLELLHAELVAAPGLLAWLRSVAAPTKVSLALRELIQNG